MSSGNPISPKVVASAAGAGLGTAVSSLIVWLLGVLVWNKPWTAAAVNDAIAAVPTTVSGLVFLLVTAASAAGPAYRVTDPSRAANPTELDALEAARLKPLPRHSGNKRGQVAVNRICRNPEDVRRTGEAADGRRGQNRCHTCTAGPEVLGLDVGEIGGRGVFDAGSSATYGAVGLDRCQYRERAAP